MNIVQIIQWPIWGKSNVICTDESSQAKIFVWVGTPDFKERQEEKLGQNW